MEFNILDMFESIEIKNDTRIPAEDLKVITELEKKFFKSRDFHFKMKELIEGKEDQDYKVSEEYYSKSKFQKDNLQEINYKAFMEESYKFISAICNYFKDKYNFQTLAINKKYNSLSFDSYKSNIKDSYEKLTYFENINKESVLDDIFEELGGFSFEDKARQEVIEYLKDETKTYRGDKKRVDIKGKKVIINEFTWVDSWSPNKISYSTRERVVSLIKAISLFEDGIINNELMEAFLIEKVNGRNSFGDFEINNNKTNKIKLFKNRRVDIEFTTTTNAINFAKEFLNYEI